MRHSNLLLATALATVTLASSAAAHDSPRSLQYDGAPSQDLRSPDARDAAEGRTTSTPVPPAYQDRRSPDTRDAADGRGTAFAAAPVITVTGADGFKWSDAAIGAGGATGLLAIATAGGIAVRHRRASTRRVVALG